MQQNRSINKQIVNIRSGFSETNIGLGINIDDFSSFTKTNTCRRQDRTVVSHWGSLILTENVSNSTIVVWPFYGEIGFRCDWIINLSKKVEKKICCFMTSWVNIKAFRSLLFTTTIFFLAKIKKKNQKTELLFFKLIF